MNNIKDICREAFEVRRSPHLDLKRNKDGSYTYQAAKMAFADFSDGFQAACSLPRGEVEKIFTED